jgi:hypothetical protein
VIFAIDRETNLLLTGEVKFKFLSLVTLYSVLVQSAIVVAAYLTLKERINYLTDLKRGFNDNILEVGCILCFSPAFMGFLNHLPETGKKARFFTDWESLQVNSCNHSLKVKRIAWRTKQLGGVTQTYSQTHRQ